MATSAGLNIKSYFVDSVNLARESARRELGENALLLRSRDAAPEVREKGRYEVVFAVGPLAETAPSPPQSQAKVESRLLKVLGDKLVCDARVGQADGGRRIILLVGPPGAGKTTTLAKLAIQQGLVRGRSVRLLSTDIHRVGGAGLLRCYAETLGVDFQTCGSTEALAQALRGSGGTDLIFIDSAGYSPSDIEGAADLARFAREREDIDTHLVLPAPTRQEDLLQMACRYEVFGPSKLLFTKLDESRSLASLYGVAAATKKPISFMAAGPAVPEDIEPATTGRVADWIWGNSTEQAADAA